MIVDANVASKVLVSENDVDFGYIRKCLFHPKKLVARLVYGGRLAREYERVAEVARIVRILDQAGKARIVADDLIDYEVDQVRKLSVCVSNDEHVIGLARASRARLLCSLDQNLHADFTNKLLIDKPRGKVYQNDNHRPLVGQFCKSEK